MIRLSKFLLVLCVGFGCLMIPQSIVRGQDAATSVEQQQRLAVVAHDLLFHRQFAKAERLFQNFLKESPDEMIGLFGMMALYQVQNLDNFDDRFNKQYLRWHEKGRDKAREIFADPDADPWDLFVAGGALFLAASYKVSEGKMLKGLRDAIMGIRSLKKAIKGDPGWVDPYFGLGVYEYWRSVYTQRLRFIPFFPDRRQEGVDKLKRVIQEGRFTNDLARGALAWIYYNEEQYKKAEALCFPLRKKYPGNLVLRTLKAHILTAKRQFDPALREYQKILAVDPQMTKVNFYIAKIYYEKGKGPKKREGEKKKTWKAKRALPKVAGVNRSYAAAIPWLERFLATEQKKKWKGQAYDLWGELLYQQGQFEEAQRKFKLALKNDYSLYNPKRRLKSLK